MRTLATPFTAEQVERVHEASLEILEQVGLQVRSAKARALLARHGCRVDAETGIVRFPRAVVEHGRAAFPPTFTFCGRDPAYDRTIPGDGPLIATASAAPNIIDPETGQERRARSDDIARMAHLVNELPGYDVFGVATTADDAPPGQFHLSRFYPALKNCLKPIKCSAPDADEVEAITRLGCLVAGGEAAYRQRPFITSMCAPLISPLTLDREGTDVLIHLAREQLPCSVAIAPNAGLTAPMSLLGTVAQGNAEFLACAVLVQMVQPGRPTLYDMVPTVADMRSLAYAPGAIETGILATGFAQMARFYSVPSAAFAGVTNAKVNDAQSGFESGMGALAAVLGGVDLLSMGGVFDALMAFDFAKAVIDHEIALMLKRALRGITFSRDDLALEVIAQVGPGGTFLDTAHTQKRMRTEALLPQIADRQPRQGWKAAGALDAQARAMRRVHEILSQDNPAVFSPEVDARIRAAFEGLVAGDAVRLGTAG
jgi:trimethylamine--corrinoid protein Co-methyltransferase